MDIHPEGHVPFIVGNIFNRFEAGLMGRIIGEDVDATELIDRFVDDAPAVCCRANIARD
jgi:hypothetical protein